MTDPDDATDFPVVAEEPQIDWERMYGKAMKSFAETVNKRNKQIADLTAQRDDLLAIAQKLIAYRDTEAGFDLMDLIDEAERVVAKTAGRKGEGR
jgi:hypothetical protein